MARIARVVVPDFPHHVVQRGVRRMDVFFSAEDRQQYLNLLSQSALSHGLEFLAWCLMSNHFVVIPISRDRSRARSEKRIADTRGWLISEKAGGVICGRSVSILILWTGVICLPPFGTWR
jgi:REP-associated tyrosine transposase